VAEIQLTEITVQTVMNITGNNTFRISIIFNDVLYGYNRNQFIDKGQTSNNPIRKAKSIRAKDCFKKRNIISFSLAPFTFRIPISFVLCCVVRYTNANNPIKATPNTKNVNIFNNDEKLFSGWYLCLSCVEKKFTSILSSCIKSA